MTTPDPCDLHDLIAELREEADALRDKVHALAAAYARLDPAALRVDTLGRATTPERAVATTRVNLLSAASILDPVRQWLDAAMSAASRLSLPDDD